VILCSVVFLLSPNKDITCALALQEPVLQVQVLVPQVLQVLQVLQVPQVQVPEPPLLS